MYEQLGQLYTDNDFESHYPRCGQSAMPPAKLALVTVMQFAEGLTDRQAAYAVRSLIDCKYVLELEIKDSVLDHTKLKEFGKR